jgi:hypothetical protein
LEIFEDHLGVPLSDHLWHKRLGGHQETSLFDILVQLGFLVSLNGERMLEDFTEDIPPDHGLDVTILKQASHLREH